MNKNINTILFDFDGTIMNTNNVIINSWQYTFRTLEGREEDVEKIVKTFGEPLADTMKKFFPNVETQEAIDIYRSYHYENFGSMISLFPNAKEILMELKAKGYKVGLVTSRLKGTTYEGLRHYEIFDYFDEIVTMEDTTKHKPDPEPIEITLKKLDSKAEEAIMIGDTNFDIMCAKNAKVKAVLVSWSLSIDEARQEELSDEEKPDYVIDDFMELLDIIEN